VQSRLNQGPLKVQGDKARHSTHPLKSSLAVSVGNDLSLRGRFVKASRGQEDVILAQKRPHNLRLRASHSKPAPVGPCYYLV